jgi:response regulator of citrate/malate metabolism
MPDDSVSEITDLDKEEVLAKYYEEKLSAVEKRKRERAEARRRIRGEDPKVNSGKHKDQEKESKNLPKGLNPLTADSIKEEMVQMELRPKSEEISVREEGASAHQFSIRSQSIQADEEEQLDLEMQVSQYN